MGTAKQRESIRSPSACSLIERWVDEVEILLIHTVLGKAQAFAEAYKMEIINLQMRHSILMESLVA